MSMIIGVGIDQIEVARVARKIQDELFMNRIFSLAEQSYCRERGRPEQHFAARFAAKEALMKALGIGLTESLELNQIEVLPNDKGKPEMTLNGIFNQRLRELNGNALHVSLSHIKETATAIVIVEQLDKNGMST